MLNSRLVTSFGGVILVAALSCTTASSAWAAPANTAPDPGVHSVYCQTPQFNTYVKFSTPGTITPGGGPVCYTGNGTVPLDLQGVQRFCSGAHSGSFQYRDQPGLPISYQPFTPGQSEQFPTPVEVISLTITS